MTREEIEKASDKYIEDYLKSSNEYPLCDNRKRMSLIQVDLYKIQEAFENGMKEADRTMLDRACEWLGNELKETDDKNGYPTVESRSFVSVKEFINEFRQAMEGVRNEQTSLE